MAVTTFRLRNPADGSTDYDLYDLVPLRDAFERFASGATLRILDPDGTKIDAYPYGRRVEVQYNTGFDASAGSVLIVESGETHTVASGETEQYRLGKNEGTVKNEGTIAVGEGGEWTTRGGFATLEPSRTTKDGMSMVEVDAVGYSHFLTREQVVKDYSSETKSDILNDLVTEFSPVVWNAANVTLEDDSAIDLALRGITPAEAISQVVAQSGEEEWGVNLDFEFFVTPQDTETSIPVTDSDVISHDLPEKGARSINKFTVYWGANEDSAWVEQDRVAQQDLADELDVSGRVVVADADSFPEITTEAEAEAMATKRLGEQSVIQTGTVTTPLGYFDTEAGDVFDLTISDAGITNEEFRVAQIDYEWGKGEVTRTIAENTGANVDELLVSLSESLTNERLQNVDPNATVLEALRVESGLTADVAASVTTKTEASDAFVLGQSQLGQGTDDELGGGVASTASVSINSDRVTATFLNLLRDLWVSGNSAFTDLTHLSVGTGTGDASRADTALESETDRVAIERFGGVDTDEIEFTATIPAGGVFAGDDAYALDFDSGSDEVSLPTEIVDSADADLSVSFWTAPDSVVGSPKRVTDFRGDVTFAVDIARNDGQLSVYTGTWNDNLVSIEADEWAQFTVTYDDSESGWTLYKNGLSVATWTEGLASDTQSKNTIGNSIGGSNPYSGAIDDFRIYDRALSGTEATNLANGDPVDPGLASHWRFDDASDPTMSIDYAGDNDGTINGATYTTDVPTALETDGDPLTELGIQDADTGGDLFSRLTTGPIDIDAFTRAKVRIRITVDDDADAQGVVTNTGQERWRDLVIGESNHEPSDFVYGDGTVAPDVTDTALANQTYTEALDSTDTGGTGVAALVDRVTSGEATTADFSEIGVENSSGELLARVVFDDYGTAVDIETTWRYVARNMA